MEDTMRGHARRRGHVRRAQKAAIATTQSSVVVQETTRVNTVTAPGIQKVVTVTVPASSPTTRAATTTTSMATAFTSTETVQGQIFTIVVEQVPPTSAASASSSSSFVFTFGNASGSVASDSVVAASPSSSVVIATTSSTVTAALASLAGGPTSTGIINPTINNDSAGGLSTGAIVGIAIGAFAAVVLALGLCFFAVGAYRDRRAREEVTDMMGTSNLPDPYSGAFISREVPGSFVRFHDEDDELASVAGGIGRPSSGMAGPGNPYDDLSMPDEDYVDVNSGANRPLSPGFRGSRAYGGAY